MQGISALTNLAGKLVKDVTDGKTPNTRDVLNHAMDSVAMLGNTNWKLNMKRRELIKPELNSPYTRLCKEDIAVSTKLFGDDLPKHLKDMSEAKKAGQQMQKPYSNSSHRGAVHSQKRNFSRFKPYHYDRTRGSGNKSTNRQPFLGQGRPSTPFRKKQPASNNTNNKNWYHPVVKSLITLCLQKIEEDQSSGVLLVPLWPTQPWFPVLLRSLVDHPRLLPQPRDLLTQPHSTTPHPLGKTLKLLAFQVSGKASSRETFQRQLHPSSCSPGLPTPISSTNHMSHSGSNFVVDGKLIHMIPL